MAYCALSDVESRLRGPALTASSTPSVSQAGDLLEDVASEINAALASHGLTTPLTAPAGFVKWLSAINADGGAASVLTARFADDRGPNSNTAAARFEARYRSALNRIWDGSAIAGGIAQSGEALPSSLNTSYPESDPVLSSLRSPAFGSDWEL